MNITGKNFICTIELLLCMLFAYSGFTKLWSYNSFFDQLLQSPLISGVFVGIIARYLPMFEILLSVMLLLPKMRELKLSVTLFMMVCFTVYLFVLFMFFEKPPCACGGILGQVSYPTHIMFNFVITLLTAVALYMHNYNKASTDKTVFHNLNPSS
jgi:hypothetical protein